MFNPDTFIAAYSCLEHGMARLNGIKYAIEQADLDNNTEWSIKFRYEYIKESIFHGDTLKAFIVFPEYIKLCDQNPNEIDSHNLMWAYKWILEDMVSFYQIPLEKINTYFEDYKKRCKEYGYGLSSYYMKLISCFEYIDSNEVKNSMMEFRKANRDVMSDCPACEKQLEIAYELKYNSYEKALRLAQNIFNGKEYCAEVPQLTYAVFMKYYMERSEWNNADYYQKLLYKKIKSNVNFLREIGWVIEYFSVVELNKGLRIFKKHCIWSENSKNPMMNFYFFNGAYKLFNAISEQGKSEIHILMPKTFEFYNEGDLYSSSGLAGIYFKKAEYIANKFDERNGTSYFMDTLNKKHQPLAETEYENIGDEFKSFPQLLSNVTQKPSYMAIVPKDITEVSSPEDIADRLNNSELFETLNIDFNEQQQIVAMISFADELYEIKIYLSAMPKLEGYMQKHSLSDEYIEIINNAETCLLTIMEFNENSLISYWLQLKVLETICTRSVCVIDYSSRTILSPIWLKITVHSNVPPTPKYLFSLSTVANRADPDTIWIYTSGLGRCGIREFDIISVNSRQYSSHLSILENFALRAIGEECFINEKEPIYIADLDNGHTLTLTWIDWKKAVANYPADMIGGLNDHKSLTSHYGTIFMYPEREDYENDNPVALSKLFEEKNIDIMFMISADETERMSILARERFSFFLQTLSDTEDAQGMVKVRIRIADDDASEEEPQFEHIWTEFIKYEGKSLTLKLLQAPYYSDDLNIGDILKTTTNEITDWTIRVKDASLIPDDIYLLFDE